MKSIERKRVSRRRPCHVREDARRAGSEKSMMLTLDRYLDALYPPGTPGELLANVKRPFVRRFGRASDLPRFAHRIRQVDAAGLDVYLSVNTLDGQSIRSRGAATRGTEAEVVAVVGLVADVDAEKPGHNYPPQARILQAVEEMPLRPTLVVLSGKADGGLHVYWLFPSPFVVQGDDDRARIKAMSVGWQRLLKSKLSPYDLDSTFDLVRVLRPVGTTNHKYGVEVRCLAFDPDCRHRAEDFVVHLPQPTPTPRQAAHRCSSALDSAKVVERARRHVAMIPPAVSGQGGHDATFHVACALVLGFDLSVEDAFPVLGEWNTACQPPWSERELIHKLQDAAKQPGPRGYLVAGHRNHDDHGPRPGAAAIRRAFRHGVNTRRRRMQGCHLKS